MPGKTTLLQIKISSIHQPKPVTFFTMPDYACSHLPPTKDSTGYVAQRYGANPALDTRFPENLQAKHALTRGKSAPL
jgi:hypothetical protein